MAKERSAAESVPRSAPLCVERGTPLKQSERDAERKAERRKVNSAQGHAPQGAPVNTKRNAKRNGKRNGSVPRRSADKSERNALANADGQVVKTPAYVADKAFPVRVLAGATQAEQGKQIARDLTAPETAATRIMVAAEGKSAYGEWLDIPGTLAELRRVARDVNAGDLSHAEAMLINQAQAMQMLSTRLIERGLNQDGLPQFEAFMRLGLRAQAQSRQSLETLAMLKQGPTVFARQANVAHGPQQVVNGAPAPLACAPANENPQTRLSLPHEQRMDGRAPGGASETDQGMAAMGKEHRTEDA